MNVFVCSSFLCSSAFSVCIVMCGSSCLINQRAPNSHSRRLINARVSICFFVVFSIFIHLNLHSLGVLGLIPSLCMCLGQTLIRFPFRHTHPQESVWLVTGSLIGIIYSPSNQQKTYGRMDSRLSYSYRHRFWISAFHNSSILHLAVQTERNYVLFSIRHTAVSWPVSIHLLFLCPYYHLFKLYLCSVSDNFHIMLRYGYRYS